MKVKKKKEIIKPINEDHDVNTSLVNDITECAGDNSRLPHDDALSFHIHLVQSEFV